MHAYFTDAWPIKVRLHTDPHRNAAAFSWLFQEIWSRNLDPKEVFTSMGRDVGFKAEYRDLALQFKLAWV